jgi:hypothetical protein
MTAPQHELIPLASPERWKDALSGLPYGISHTWEYCQAMYQTTHYPTYLYLFSHGDQRVACVFCERDFAGTTDIVSPYGFNGFVANADCPAFNHQWKEFLKHRGYVCGYIGLNPIWDLDLGFPEEELYSSNEVYVLDLSRSAEDVMADMSQNRRRQIRKASQETGHYTSDKASVSSFFMAHYSGFMEEKKVSSAYHFTGETLKMLIQCEQALLVGYIQGEEVLAASLFGYTSTAADFLFNVSVDEGRQYSAGLMWIAIRELQTLKIPTLNLGGGIRSGDALAGFKERFGGSKVKLASLRQVYNREVFEELCQAGGTGAANNNYFPPYRLGQIK